MQQKFYYYTMQFGIYMGLLITLNFILSSSSNSLLSFFSWIVWGAEMALLYYFTLKYRRQETNDILTYGQSFRFIFMTYIFGALLATALRIVYLKWINPEVLTELFNQSMQALDKVSVPDKNAVKDALATFLKPVQYSFLYLWIDLFAGVLYALVIAAFTRKTERNANQPQQQDDEDIVG